MGNKTAKSPQRRSTNWVLFTAIPVLIAAILAYVSNVRSSIPGLSRTQHPSVTIRQGTIVGRMVDDGTFPEPLEGFMGIPYALPPVNDLRFRPAVPVPSANGTYQAFYLGPRYAKTSYMIRHWRLTRILKMPRKTTCSFLR